MFRGLRLAAAAAGLLGACCVGSSSAAPRVSVPAPQLASVVLAFIRVFKSGAKLGGQPLSLAVGIGLLEQDAATAQADFADLQHETQTKAGRLAIAKSWGTAFITGSKLKVKSTVVSPPVALGDGGLRLALTISTNLGTVRMALGFVETDRVVDIVVLGARLNRAVAQADVGRAVSAVRQHLRAAFSVASTVQPVIGGTPQQGQTLTVDEGTWSGAPSGFAYVWLRCDATGGACAPIAGATANTYVPGGEDSGMTIRVAVTGSSTVSSQQAISLPSAPIP